MAEKTKSLIKSVSKNLIDFLFCLLLTAIVCVYLVQPIIVEGNSMYPNLKSGDFGVTSKMFKIESINRFDLVVLKIDGKNIIKRVIGLPGEDVNYIDSKLYIDNVCIEENFTAAKTENLYLHVPEGEFFCLGDNRTDSLDSRYYGTFKAEQIIGKDIVILFPFKRTAR